MRKFLSIFILFGFVFFVLPIHAPAAITDELRQKIQDAQIQRDKLLEEQKKLQVELDTLNTQGKTLQGAVKTLDTTKKKLENDIKLTQSKITNADLNIQSLEKSMTEKEQEIALHQQAISLELQELSGFDAHSTLTDLLSYKKLGDVWNDRTNLADIGARLSKEIGALKDAQIILEQEKALKEKTKLSLVGLKSELGGQKKVVENTQATKAELLAQTKSKEAEYQKLLADNIAREKKFEADLFDFESQLKIALDPNSIPDAKFSILAWPLAKVKITQQFGITSSSKRLYASGSHNGVDFGIPVGSAVMAVRGGVVSGTGNTDLSKGCYSYGRWILIKHDNGLSTVYGHLSASLVQTGQTVTAGQTIGYSGGMPGVDGSGYSTGPHLHLGLYATQAVRVEQYTNSVNCKNASIPISPPNGYLDPLAYLPSL